MTAVVLLDLIVKGKRALIVFRRDQQIKFLEEDRVRHVLVTGLQDTETAVKWNNALQALAEGIGFGIPANNSSDPRHGVGSDAEYMAAAGEPIS